MAFDQAANRAEHLRLLTRADGRKVDAGVGVGTQFADETAEFDAFLGAVADGDQRLVERELDGNQFDGQPPLTGAGTCSTSLPGSSLKVEMRPQV